MSAPTEENPQRASNMPTARSLQWAPKPMTRQHTTDTHKDPDAARARWTLWLTLGGNVFGLMFDSDALSAALRHRSYAYGSHSDVSTLGLLLGDFVLPVAVTALAPRKSFLWAAAALGITLAWSLADRAVALNWPGLIHDLESNGLEHSLALLFFCGPIALVRLLMRRGRDGRVRRLAEQQAWMRRAAEAQAGVWPPPVRTDGRYGEK